MQFERSVRLSKLNSILVAIVILASLGWPVYGAESNREACAGILNSPSYSVLALSPHVQVLMVGLLAEGEHGERYLAFSDYYWGGHEEIYRELSEKYPLRRILWAGELLIENSQNKVAPGVVMLSINTSGFYKRRLMGGGHDDLNKPYLLQSSLNAYKPSLTTPHSQHLPYEFSDVHIDPLFRMLHKRLQPTDPDDTVRHRFRNMLNSLYLVYQEITHPAAQPSFKMARISRIDPENILAYLTFAESQARYSVRAQSDQVKIHAYCEELQRLRETKPEDRDENYNNKLAKVIEDIGPLKKPKFHIEVLAIPPETNED